MQASYEQLGVEVEVEEADFRDILGIMSVHATTFIETYHTEDIPTIPPESPSYLSRSILEHFVYKSGFIERSTDTWAQRLENQTEDNTVLVARDDTRIVGFSHTYVEGLRGMINALYILPEYQKMGLGKALIGRLLDNAGIQKIDLLVARDIPAIDFYRHHGFEIAQALPQDECPEMAPGKWLYQLKMARENVSPA